MGLAGLTVVFLCSISEAIDFLRRSGCDTAMAMLSMSISTVHPEYKYVLTVTSIDKHDCTFANITGSIWMMQSWLVI